MRKYIVNYINPAADIRSSITCWATNGVVHIETEDACGGDNHYEMPVTSALAVIAAIKKAVKEGGKS